MSTIADAASSCLIKHFLYILRERVHDVGRRVRRAANRGDRLNALNASLLRLLSFVIHLVRNLMTRETHILPAPSDGAILVDDFFTYLYAFVVSIPPPLTC